MNISQKIPATVFDEETHSIKWLDYSIKNNDFDLNKYIDDDGGIYIYRKLTNDGYKNIICECTTWVKTIEQTSITKLFKTKEFKNKDDAFWESVAFYFGMDSQQYIKYLEARMNKNKKVLKTTSSFFKRILSYLVLLLCHFLISFFIILMISLASYLFMLIDELNIFLRLICYFIGGSTLVSLLIAPIVYGPMLIVAPSNAISPSKKGIRFFVLSIYMIFTNAANLIISLINSDFNSYNLITIILYLVVIVSYKEFIETNN